MNPTTAVAASPPALPDVHSHVERGMLPTNDPRSTRLFHRMCLVVLLVLISASSFSAFHEKWHFREQGTRGTYVGVEFDRMIDGSALRSVYLPPVFA